MSNTYSSRDNTQPMLGYPTNGTRQSSQSRIPLQLNEASVDSRTKAVPLHLEEVDVQAYTPVSSTRNITRVQREPVIRRTELVYESNCVPFRSILTPLVALKATNSDNGSRIKFEMIHDHLTGHVVLTWEPFQGIISSGGTDCLEVQQSISHLPEFITDLSIPIEVRGVRKQSFVRIDPYTDANIKFYLDISGSGSMILDNDKVFVPSSCVHWKSEK